MNVLDSVSARRIIQELGSSGQPPESGLQHFTVGLDKYLSVIDDEYLSTFIKDGGAAFKMVVGIYGGGKTHFLYSVRDLAWHHKYAISYVSLKSSGECPFSQLDLVYKAVINGLLPPPSEGDHQSSGQQGIGAFLKTWYGQQFQAYLNHGMSDAAARSAIREDIQQITEIASVSFQNAIRAALEALMNNQETTFSTICQWIQGEGFERRTHGNYGILQKIDRTTAFTMIRSLGQVIRRMGYNGLVILLDEAERVPSLSTRQRDQHLSNLRELIDECGHTTFQGLMILYAVPDEQFLDGRTMIYQALSQRLATTFTTINPTGVKIELEKTIVDHVSFLKQVGEKLVGIYEIAYSTSLPQPAWQPMVAEIADWAHEQRFEDEGYKRVFVQKLVQGLHFVKREGHTPSIEDLR